ncbi:MAG: HAD-IIIC family phosphatase [Clostridia bacterium]|nr:HAD-IIIC family phosphatase [Clostridia bacterium]
MAENIKPFNLSVLGDTSTQQLSIALKGYAKLENIKLNIFDSPYNQIEAQLLDSKSDCFETNPNAILIYISTEKLYEKFLNLSNQDRVKFAEDEANRIKMYWDRIKANSKAKILQYNFVYINDEVFGSFAAQLKESFSFQLTKLNYLIANLSKENNVHVIDLNALQSKIGREKLFDEKLYYIAKMAISTNALYDVASITIPVIKCLIGNIKKCVILDLDNTLWGGVIGDVGIENIEIGDYETGRAFTAFQKYLKELKDRGIILAVCSKNNQDVAMKPFEEHPDMVLKLDDIAIFIANWEDKAANIKYIQQTLNIAMDSIVFIDDSEFERNAVKALIPNLCVPEMPEDPALYTSYIQSLKLFETISYSEEDKERTTQYQEEFKRVKEQSLFEDYNAYLQSLDMKASVKDFDAFSIPRIAQLTQRSNQFNLRTIRYTEQDIKDLVKDENNICKYFTLKDHVGDYGIIAALIMKKQDDALFIDTLIMSCRVLKRGMEEFIFNKIVEIAAEKDLDIIGEYIKTPKNALVENLYKDFGFEERDGKYYLSPLDYTKFNTTIREEND